MVCKEHQFEDYRIDSMNVWAAILARFYKSELPRQAKYDTELVRSILEFTVSRIQSQSSQISKRLNMKTETLLVRNSSSTVVLKWMARSKLYAGSGGAPSKWEYGWAAVRLIGAACFLNWLLDSFKILNTTFSLPLSEPVAPLHLLLALAPPIAIVSNAMLR